MPRTPPSPPPGYTPIPDSASGGYHRRTAKGWVHWYPSKEAARTAFRDHDHKAGKMLEAAARVRDIDADTADALAKEGRRHHRLSEAAQRAAFDPDYEAPIAVGGHMVTPDSPAHEHAREAAHTRQGADGMRRAAPRFVHPEGRREAEREAGQYEARHTAALHRLQRAEGYHGEVQADPDPDPEHTALLRGRARLNRRLGEIVASARSNGDRSTEARLEAVRGYLPEGRPGGGPNSPSSTPPRDLRKALAVLARATRQLGWGPAAMSTTATPPDGFEPVPGSRSGGYRQHGPAGFRYWYPSHAAALTGLQDRVVAVIGNAMNGHEARQLAHRSTAANAAMNHQTADRHAAMIPRLLADAHAHGVEVRRHLDSSDAAPAALPGRLGLVNAIENVHESAGTAALDGDRLLVPYSDTPEDTRGRPLDVRNASDAELLIAAAQTAADNPEHAHHLLRAATHAREQMTGAGERLGFEQDMAARVARMRAPVARPRARPQLV